MGTPKENPEISVRSANAGAEAQDPTAQQCAALEQFQQQIRNDLSTTLWRDRLGGNERTNEIRGYANDPYRLAFNQEAKVKLDSDGTLRDLEVDFRGSDHPAIKETFFPVCPDHRSVLQRAVSFNSNGTKLAEAEYDPSSGKPILKESHRFDSNGKEAQDTKYTGNGQVYSGWRWQTVNQQIQKVEFKHTPDNSGNTKTKLTKYETALDPDGKTLIMGAPRESSIAMRDPKGKIIWQDNYDADGYRIAHTSYSGPIETSYLFSTPANPDGTQNIRVIDVTERQRSGRTNQLSETIYNPDGTKDVKDYHPPAALAWDPIFGTGVNLHPEPKTNRGVALNPGEITVMLGPEPFEK